MTEQELIDKIQSGEVEVTLDEDVDASCGCEASGSEPVFFATPLILSTENIAESEAFDVSEFNKGKVEASLYAGMYTVLVNSGIAYDDCIKILMNHQNMMNNVDLAKINADAAVEQAKYVGIQIEKSAV